MVEKQRGVSSGGDGGSGGGGETGGVLSWLPAKLENGKGQLTSLNKFSDSTTKGKNLNRDVPDWCKSGEGSIAWNCSR